MKQLPSRPLVLIGTFVCLLIALALTKSGNTQSLNREKAKDPNELVNAVRRGGLREAARIKGTYVNTQLTGGWMKFNLDGLVSHSSEIIVGTSLQRFSHVSKTGESIFTDHRVRIDQILKGKFEPNRVIDVSVLGGKVTFDDGTSAEIRTPDLGLIEENQSYIFFLHRGEEENGFRLTGGGQGLFRISLSDSTIKTLGHKKDVVRKYENEDATRFLEEIKTSIKKYPKTVPCCK